MKPELLATLRAAGEAATKGPWYRGNRIISAGIEPPGLEGTGKCALCHPSRPLHSVVPRGYHSEYGGKISDLHRHIDPEPHRVDHVIQSEDGELVAGNYDYEDGGIVNPVDAAFIAHARNHWDELLDEIERLRVALCGRCAVALGADGHAGCGECVVCLRERIEQLASWNDTAEKLNRRVVANAGRLSSERKPRWAHVADATALGSTAAARLCSDHGFDCGELVGGGK